MKTVKIEEVREQGKKIDKALLDAICLRIRIIAKLEKAGYKFTK